MLLRGRPLGYNNTCGLAEPLVTMIQVAAGQTPLVTVLHVAAGQNLCLQ